MWIDPEFIKWAIILLASGCASMIGYLYANYKQEQTIDSCITYLIDNNFIKAKQVNGEWEIIKLNEEK
tara:strand:+ start:2835 stop:3038 length:204 start_codon:yes stop_codon:yes gene_type:complete